MIAHLPAHSPVHAGAETAERVAVLDIGSNSVRLVIFQGNRRVPVPVFNEKTLSALGAEIAQTGRLSERGRTLALTNIARFLEIARAMDVRHLTVLATAAVRDAANGAEFVAYLEQRFGVTVRLLSGDEEARLSALGVISACPDADGVVGDLGGGSLELIDIAGGTPQDSYATLPLGSLRLGPLTAENHASLAAEIDRQLASLPWLGQMAGRTLYAVGGAWRSLARAHMTASSYPLEIIHGYLIAADEAGQFFDTLSRLPAQKATQKAPRKAGVPGVAGRRTATLPLSALILSRLLHAGRPRAVVFSAFGIREGYLYDRLDAQDKALDPLLSLAGELAHRLGRFAPAPAPTQALERWVRGFVSDDSVGPGAPGAPGVPGVEPRLITAICMLGDLVWLDHPRYRAEQAWHQVLRLPAVGINHGERAFLALAAWARHGGAANASTIADVAGLLPPETHRQARIVGLALRFGYTFCGGLIPGLAETRIRSTKDALVVQYRAGRAAAEGDAIDRRRAQLASELGKAVVLEAVETGELGPEVGATAESA